MLYKQGREVQLLVPAGVQSVNAVTNKVLNK